MPFEISWQLLVASFDIMPSLILVWNYEIYYGIAVKNILVAIWLIGVIVNVVKLFYRHRQFTSVFRFKTEIKDENILNISEEIKKGINFKRRVGIYYIHPEYIPFPVAIGVFKQIIVLPLTYQFSNEELCYILKHELLHSKYHNVLLKALAMLISCLLWFNPVAYLFNKSIHEFFEYHVDYLTGGKSQDDQLAYAQCLIRLCRNAKVKEEGYNEGIKEVPFNVSRIIKRKRKSSFLKRIEVLLNHKQDNKMGRKIVFGILRFAIIFSFFVIFQAEYHAPYYTEELQSTVSENLVEVMEDSLTLTVNDAYILKSLDGNYYVYMDDMVFRLGVSIPENFVHLPVIIE
jgi:beta-lactamase regulating signal transducer with metallopeptidase domain